jgi:DNA-binding response OmpR family regulator
MAGELQGKKILLVDDDQDILAALKGALADMSPQIETASDGNTAIERNEVFKPDLVVLDMMLPKRSGFLVLEQIKKGKKRTDPPRVIMITGNQGARHKSYAEGLGADVYLNKPFRMERFLESLRKIFGIATPGDVKE